MRPVDAIARGCPPTERVSVRAAGGVPEGAVRRSRRLEGKAAEVAPDVATVAPVEPAELRRGRSRATAGAAGAAAPAQRGVIVERKWDGDRIQAHIMPSKPKEKPEVSSTLRYTIAPL